MLSFYLTSVFLAVVFGAIATYIDIANGMDFTVGDLCMAICLILCPIFNIVAVISVFASMASMASKRFNNNKIIFKGKK